MYRQENRKNKFGSSKWKEGMADQTYRYALLGATYKQMAEFFQVTIDTISYWMLNNPEFSEAFNRGKAEADANVAFSLYRRATGYTYTEKVAITNKNGDVTRVEEITKHLPGDVTACLKWLSMRQRENWTEISKSEHHINYSAQIDVRYLTDQLKDKNKFSNEELENALQNSLRMITENAGKN